MQSIEQFGTTLDEAWTRKRLTEFAAQTHWPTREELVDYFLEDVPSAEGRREIEAHIKDCAMCRGILEELRQGAAELERADPLGEVAAAPAPARVNWLDALRSLVRPAAWPAWSLAGAVAVALFVLGFLLRPSLWPPAPGRPLGPMAQLTKPPLQRQPDGTIALGIGATTARPEARALFERALASYDAPDFADRAAPVLEQAVKADPSFEQARFWLAICYLLKGNTTAATPQLEEAVRLAPGNVTYQHYLVWAYLKAGEYEKAMEAQSRVLRTQGTK
jgi:hypothetical protein